MKKFLKSRWKGLLFILIITLIWVVPVFLGPIPTSTYCILLAIYTLNSVFNELHEYWHIETILILNKKQKIVDEEMISIVEDLASEIVYPEKGLHWEHCRQWVLH